MDWSASRGGNRYGASGVVTSGNTSGTVVTAPTTANTKTGAAWATLLPNPTDTPGEGIALTMFNTSITITTRLIDIGIGASGSEKIIIPDLLYSNGIADIPSVVYFPIRIPLGVRLAARMQASSGASSIILSAIVHSGVWSGVVPLSRAIGYGATLASSRGISVDAGATVNTKPATWTTLAASTTEPARGLVVGVGNQILATRSAVTWLLDIGIGTAGSEKALIPNYLIRSNLSEMVTPNFSPFFPVSIPAGSRISARCQCSSSTSPSRLLDVMVYTVI